MKDIAKASLNRMGRFNNQLVEVVDKTDATPIEVIVILRRLVLTIEQLFELSTKPREKK